MNGLVQNNSNKNLTEEVVQLLSKYLVQCSTFLAKVIIADMLTLPSFSDLNSAEKLNGQNHQNNREFNYQEIVKTPPVIQPDNTPNQAVQLTGQQQHLHESTAQHTTNNVEKILVEHIVRQTGYPSTTIGLELKLLDDLNLYSIKAGDLVAEVAKQCRVAGKVDPSSLANASLVEVAAAIRSEMPGKAKPSSSPAPTIAVPPQVAESTEPKPEAKPKSGANWVRNFTVEYVSQGR